MAPQNFHQSQIKGWQHFKEYCQDYLGYTLKQISIESCHRQSHETFWRLLFCMSKVEKCWPYKSKQIHPAENAITHYYHCLDRNLLNITNNHQNYISDRRYIVCSLLFALYMYEGGSKWICLVESSVSNTNEPAPFLLSYFCLNWV